MAAKSEKKYLSFEKAFAIMFGFQISNIIKKHHVRTVRIRFNELRAE